MMLTLGFARVNFVLFWPSATKFPCVSFRRILAHCSEKADAGARSFRGAGPGTTVSYPRKRADQKSRADSKPLSPQAHHLAAVDHDGCAGQEAAGVGSQQQQRAVEVALLAEPPGRDLPGDLRALFSQKLAVDLGDHIAGRNRIDPHAPEGELERQRLGELDDTGLGNAIADQALVDAEAENRRDIDDRAALLGGDHAPGRLLSPEKHRVEVGREDAPPLRLLDLDGAIRMSDA